MNIIIINAVLCGSCIIMKNRWNEIEKEYNINLTRYDYDFDEDEVKKYDVGTILPVSIFLDKNNNEIYRLIGEKKKEEITKVIDSIVRGEV